MTAGASSGHAVNETAVYPASFAQELLWITHRASADTVAYNVPRVRRLRGALDVNALRRAFEAIMTRHEILRTTYAMHEDRAVQVIHPQLPLPFDVIDLSHESAEAREASAARIMRERTVRPFDLAHDALLRVTLLRFAPDDHLLLFESHHIAFDGWSRDIVFRELAAYYKSFTRDVAADLPALPIQYADYAIWQREHLQGARLDDLLAWWRSELAGAEQVLRLPIDFSRPSVSRFDGFSRRRTLSSALREGIRVLGERFAATPYMVLLAAYGTVLHRYTGQDDVLVGSPVAGRAGGELEHLIGYFANTIVQRLRFAGDPSFAQLLARLRESAIGAYDHQEVPFEKLVLDMVDRAARGVSPLFQVVFTQLDSGDAPAARMGDVTLEAAGLDTGTTKFDLTLFMHDKPGALELMLRARSELHRPDSIERFLGHIESVLDAVTANPDIRISAVPLLTSAERHEVGRWNDTRVDEGTPATVVELLGAQARRLPERVAVVAGARTSAGEGGAAESTTYEALERRANQLAHKLVAMGVRRDVPVALLLDRSADALVAMLGILKAGGAFVPVSPDAPTARLTQLLAEGDAKIVVTQHAIAQRLPASAVIIALDHDPDAVALQALPVTPPEVRISPDDLAYVLFTSGSTGTPKGVAVSHRNLVHYARAVSRVLADVPHDQPGDGFAALEGWHFGVVSTLSADLGHTSLFVSLLSGGTLHLLPHAATTEPSRYAEYVRANPLDVLKVTPNHFMALAHGKASDSLAEILPSKWIVCGGEALALGVAHTLVESGKCRVLNHYGPTETTVGVCTFEATAESLGRASRLGALTVPIGYPLANTRARVLGGGGLEQPTGVPGELLIGGDGVARGYFERDDLTAERFVAAEGERLYRTGDRVRRLPDGAIEFLGRTDDQVKIRGYRVELGEITDALRRQPGIARGTVVLRTEEDGPKLVAYVVVRKDGYGMSHNSSLRGTDIIDGLARVLPEYMVPSAVVILDELPLTANGKVDAAKLPAPGAGAATDRFAAPRTETEIQLAKIWTDVLKKDRIGITDDFLALGGHSLLAIRALGKISKIFGLRLPLRSLFDAPTVEQLAELIDLERKLAALESMSDEDAVEILRAEASPT